MVSTSFDVLVTFWSGNSKSQLRNNLTSNSHIGRVVSLKLSWSVHFHGRAKVFATQNDIHHRLESCGKFITVSLIKQQLKKLDVILRVISFYFLIAKGQEPLHKRALVCITTAQTEAAPAIALGTWTQLTGNTYPRGQKMKILCKNHKKLPLSLMTLRQMRRGIECPTIWAQV